MERKLLTDEELENFTFEFPAEWPEYARIEAMYNALTDASKLVAKKLQ